ncbi:response regulator [Sulfurimonas sp. HSL-1716]|uniref:response regulator n=1 Tax=Hydrocurvibacter sulfurireducens TaxID=3131937 RepID=UPI0031F8FDFB
MQGLTKVIEQFPEHAEIIVAFAKLEKHLFFIFNDKGELLGCNYSTYEALGFSTYDEFLEYYDDMNKLVEPKEGCVDISVAGWINKLEEGKDHCIDIKNKEQEIIPCTLRLQSFALNGVVLHLILLENQYIIERAKKAHEYFENFKKQFLKNISHEFRTPMNSIIGFAELLKNTNLDNSQKEYVNNIDSSSHMMMDNIENLLDMMQIESGVVEVKNEPFYPFEEFERFFGEYCSITGNKKLQIFFLIDPHIPKEMEGDFYKIKRVLMNLISNAMKYSKDKDGKIVVELKARYNQENVQIEYSVSDNGIGISQDKLKTILRPFAAVYEKQRVAESGIGIGLNLSHRLLSMLGSKLKVKSQLGKGSRFYFEIIHKIVEKTPYEFVSGSKIAVWAEEKGSSIQQKVLEEYLRRFEVNVVEIDGLAHKELDSSLALFILTDYISSSRVRSIKTHYKNLQIVQVCHKDAKSGCEAIIDEIDGFVILPLLPHKLYDVLKVLWKKASPSKLKYSTFKNLDSKLYSAKILIAEDNEINRKLLRTILENENYSVSTADNGQMAIDMFLKEDFDLVLMDIDMPVMDGIVATRLIKEYDKKRKVFTPVIALTAHALSGDRERILSAGLDAHLAKPIDREFLLQVIDRYLSEKLTNRTNLDNFV